MKILQSSKISVYRKNIAASKRNFTDTLKDETD